MNKKAMTKLYERPCFIIVLEYLTKRKLIEMQMINSLFYLQYIPEAIESLKPEFCEEAKKLDHLFRSDEFLPDKLQFWRYMKPLTVEIFYKYWNKVIPEEPMINTEQTCFEW